MILLLTVPATASAPSSESSLSDARWEALVHKYAPIGGGDPGSITTSIHDGSNKKLKEEDKNEKPLAEARAGAGGTCHLTAYPEHFLETFPELNGDDGLSGFDSDYGEGVLAGTVIHESLHCCTDNVPAGGGYSCFHALIDYTVSLQLC